MALKKKDLEEYRKQFESFFGKPLLFSIHKEDKKPRVYDIVLLDVVNASVTKEKIKYKKVDEDGKPYTPNFVKCILEKPEGFDSDEEHVWIFCIDEAQIDTTYTKLIKGLSIKIGTTTYLFTEKDTDL